MALETLTGSAVFLDALVPTNPAGTDGKNQGDDHLRGLKQAIHNTFPNIGASVSASAGELNVLAGATVSAGELNVLSATPAISNQTLYMHSNQAVLQGVAVGTGLSFDASAGIVNLDFAGLSAMASVAASDEFVLLDASDGDNKRVRQNQLAGSQPFNYITTVSAGGSANFLVFSNFLSESAYDSYYFEFDGLITKSGDQQVFMQFEVSAGGYASGVQSMTLYAYNQYAQSANFKDVIVDLARANTLSGPAGNDSGMAVDGWARVKNTKVSTTGLYNKVMFRTFATDQNYLTEYRGSGWNSTLGNQNTPGVRFYFNSGAVLSGKIRQYGLKET